MDTTSYDTLYQELNWMSFAGIGMNSSSSRVDDKEIFAIGTPYKSIYSNHGYEYDFMQDLEDGDKKFMIVILERDKKPAAKRVESTDIISSSGSYIEDHGFYSNGSVSYTCLLTPRYGGSYGADACYTMLTKILGYIENIQGYGCLSDSYENRWCYAAFSGCSDIQAYKNSIQFTLNFTCKPEWYSNSWGDSSDTTSCIKIDDFSPYTGKADSGAINSNKMYKLISTCPHDCPPLLKVNCDGSASAWSLTFPASTYGTSDLDITLNFSYPATLWVDCIAHGVLGSYSSYERLPMMSGGQQGLLYTSTATETYFKSIPYKYPVIRHGYNYIYGSGIKSLTIYPMYWQL